jgi:hypothetical protein
MKDGACEAGDVSLQSDRSSSNVGKSRNLAKEMLINMDGTCNIWEKDALLGRFKLCCSS